MRDKEKDKIYQAEYRRAHRDEHRTYVKAWAERNKDTVKASKRAYYLSHREQWRESQRRRRATTDGLVLHRVHNREWNARHKERVNETTRRWQAQPENKYRLQAATQRWRAKNPEAIHQYHVNRRARKHDAFIEKVYRHVVFARDGGICQICKQPVSRDAMHVDHIVPLAKGGKHEYANVQLAHPHCNISKGARSSIKAA